MSLLNRLRQLGIEDRDIEKVLSFASGGGARMPSLRDIEFISGGAAPELFARVRFKNGRISRLELGGPLSTSEAQDALIARARGEALDDHGSVVVTRVLFSQRPLKGTYYWENRLRIRPCTDIARLGKGLDWFDIEVPGVRTQPHEGPPFPFLLEVRITRSPNPFIESARTLRFLDRYQFLLTLFLTGNLGVVHWPPSPVWALLKPNGIPENHLVHPSFSTNENGRLDDFPKTHWPEAPVYTANDYYERLWPQEAELHIPSTLGEYLSTFHTLDRSNADAFLRACYWHALGIQFSAEPSLAIVAFATAIECLLPRPIRKSCSMCGSPSGPGPTQLFNQHLKRYGKVLASLEKFRGSLYDVRSTLVHGSRASRVDLDFMSFQQSDRDRLLLLAIVAQRSLINWLEDPKRASWHEAVAAPHGNDRRLGARQRLFGIG